MIWFFRTLRGDRMYKIIIETLWNMAFGDGVIEGVVSIFQAIWDTAFISQTNILFVLDIQQYFDNVGISFSGASRIIFSFSYYLIILKFVKKVLDIYALQTDGDSEMDISVLITNFCKAMVISLSFTIIYEWIVDLAEDFSRQLLNSVSLSSVNTLAGNVETIGNTYPNIVVYILSPIYILLSTVLTIFQLKNGLEIWLLRLGMPLACCGLLDADQGVYRTYTRLITKAFLTVIVQIFLLATSFYVISFIPTDNQYGAIILLFIAIIFLILAFATPKMLSDLLIPKQSNGGRVMQAVYMGSILFRGVM